MLWFLPLFSLHMCCFAIFVLHVSSEHCQINHRLFSGSYILPHPPQEDTRQTPRRAQVSATSWGQDLSAAGEDDE